MSNEPTTIDESKVIQRSHYHVHHSGGHQSHRHHHHHHNTPYGDSLAAKFFLPAVVMLSSSLWFILSILAIGVASLLAQVSYQQPPTAPKVCSTRAQRKHLDSDLFEREMYSSRHQKRASCPAVIPLTPQNLAQQSTTTLASSCTRSSSSSSSSSFSHSSASISSAGCSGVSFASDLAQAPSRRPSLALRMPTMKMFRSRSRRCSSGGHVDSPVIEDEDEDGDEKERNGFVSPLRFKSWKPKTPSFHRSFSFSVDASSPIFSPSSHNQNHPRSPITPDNPVRTPLLSRRKTHFALPTLPTIMSSTHPRLARMQTEAGVGHRRVVSDPVPKHRAT